MKRKAALAFLLTIVVYFCTKTIMEWKNIDVRTKEAQLMDTNKQEPAGSILEKLHIQVKPISNGWLMKTRSGWWYYPDNATLVAAMSEYLIIVARDYKEYGKTFLRRTDMDKESLSILYSVLITRGLDPEVMTSAEISQTIAELKALLNHRMGR